MKSRRFVSVLLVLGAASFAFAQNPGAVTPKPLSTLEQTLLAQDSALTEAYKKKDIEFLKRVLTDDFVAIGTDGRPFGKGDLVENFRETKIDDYRPYEISVVPVNDSAAIVTYDCVVRMMVFDETLPRYQHVSNLWVKQGDQWRLKFQQATTAQ